MTRVTTLLAGALAIGLLASPAAAADRTTTKSGPLPSVKDLPLPGCDFEVLMTDRGGRTLTTTYDGDTVVRQTVTGTSDVELEGGPLGVTLLFTIRERAVLDYSGDGLGATLTQQGLSGLAIDPGTISGTPKLTWYGGYAKSVGRYDDTAEVPTLSSVETQSIHGLTGDVCEMLVAGLKSRH